MSRDALAIFTSPFSQLRTEHDRSRLATPLFFPLPLSSNSIAMEEDDDFGDLYTDVLHVSSVLPLFPANQKSRPIAVSGSGGGLGSGSDSDEEEDKILPGSSLPFAPVPESSTIDRERKVSVEDADDDWLLGRDPAPVEEPTNWVDDDEEVVLDRDSKDAVRGLSSKGGGARVLEKGDAEEASRISKREGDALDGEGYLEKKQALRDSDDELVIPGLATPAALNGVLVKASESDDWDSGSEDDLQIVLNDTSHDLLGLEGRDGGGSDEDEEDLVIVTDDDQRHHHQAMEEQDWGDDAMQSSVDGEKKEMLEVAKASGVAPTVTGAGIGYSNHGFHPQHHSMFKYVRPGATPTPRGPGMVAAGAPGQVRPPAFGPLAGRGRGDWRPVGGIGFPNTQKGFHSGYGLPTWGNIASGRPFGGGLDFSLPSHKTVFDIDIESFEEKPWRHPGVDISDFFNFGLDEEHWKEYCKQLEQLRLESTMQGKIRVYESGRSEQDYDPDLPPELAAATGHNNMSAGNINHDKSENGLADLNDQGKESACMRPALPTGRPIQVESGFGERLPSIDTRPPRFRDLDAVIEIVLQDNLGDSRDSNSAFEQLENNIGRENHRASHDVDKDDRPAESESDFYGHFPHSANVQQRESVARRIPISAEGDGVLPFTSESSCQYNSSPKSRSPIDTARSFEIQHGGRSLQRTPYGKNSSASEHLIETLSHRNVHLDKHEGYHKERANDGSIEVNRASDSPPSDIARELSMEPKDVEHDDRLTLGDSHEGDGGEASDFRVSSETVGEDGLINSANRQKFISCVGQSGGQDNGIGDDSRLTHSDNSLTRSGNSRDYQKIHETGEEVMQVHLSKHTGDLSKHNEEDDRRHRDDYGRDGRREVGRNRSRARETMQDSYVQKDWDAGSGHTFRGRSVDFEREMDGSVGPWHRREDDAHYRQIKDEDNRRVYNEEIRSRERSKARIMDRKEKIEDHVKKRVDEGDWRGHSRDDGLRHRERNDIFMNRRDNLEDVQMKRTRDVELARRERAEKEDSLHGYRVREDSHRKKRIRDDIVDHRKREDNVRTKNKIEERHSSKHKDENWYQRDREDRQHLAHDETLGLQGREERRFASRTGRPVEKIFVGTGRSKEDLKVAVSEKGYHDNSRRRHNEQSKRGDGTGEENESLSKVRVDIHTREKRFNAEQRSMRHERLSAHADRPAGASDEHQVHKERHRESSKKVEDSEPNGQKGVSGKRKRGGNNSHRTELNSKGSSEHHPSNNRSTTEGKKARGNTEQMEASLLPTARHGDEDPASDGESHDSRRGRSKLERWTSHKERDYSVVDSNIQTSSIVREVEDSQDELNELVKADASKPDNTEANADDLLQVADKVGEERDRHLDTVAKLKMRSERFKLPMPGEKDKDLTGNKKVESEAPPSSYIQNEAVSTASADLDIKLERPARKRKWTGS